MTGSVYQSEEVKIKNIWAGFSGAEQDVLILTKTRAQR